MYKLYMKYKGIISDFEYDGVLYDVRVEASAEVTRGDDDWNIYDFIADFSYYDEELEEGVELEEPTPGMYDAVEEWLYDHTDKFWEV